MICNTQNYWARFWVWSSELFVCLEGGFLGLLAAEQIVRILSRASLFTFSFKFYCLCISIVSAAIYCIKIEIKYAFQHLFYFQRTFDFFSDISSQTLLRKILEFYTDCCTYRLLAKLKQLFFLICDWNKVQVLNRVHV